MESVEAMEAMVHGADAVNTWTDRAQTALETMTEITVDDLGRLINAAPDEIWDARQRLAQDPAMKPVLLLESLNAIRGLFLVTGWGHTETAKKRPR